MHWMLLVTGAFKGGANIREAIGDELATYDGIFGESVTEVHFKSVPTLQIPPCATAHLDVTIFSAANVQNVGGLEGGTAMPAPSQYKQPRSLHSENSFFSQRSRWVQF